MRYNYSMSSGVGLFSGQGRRGSKRFLQPPQISNNFDIWSSQQQQEEAGSVEEPIHDLSNVEERSNFDSEREEPDHSDIATYLAKMQLLEERQITPPQRSARSQRLEDQEIIVVEEGAEVCSDVGNNESVILEHIEFANDTHPENTPEWEEPRSRDGVSREQAGRSRAGEGRKEEAEEGEAKGQEVRYVINLVPESPPWVHDNMSSSTPYDIESSGFKLTPNRNSKNTCIDRTEPLLPGRQDRPNKSCIEQPFRFDEEPPATPKLGKYSSLKGCKIQHILDKWNQEIYPRLETQYLDAPIGIGQPPRKTSAEFQMERDAKFCHSGYEEPSSPSVSAKGRTRNDAETQTDLAGEELLNNERYLNEEVTQLQSRNKKLQEELRVLREEMRVLRTREAEMQGKSQRQTHEQSQQQRRWGEVSRQLSSRNQELQRMVSQQNETIRYFQEKQQTLQKKLHKTISYQTLYSTPDDRSPSFFAGEFQTVKLNKLHTFGMEEQLQQHEKCRREAEELQETIFDLEQQIAGIDIEVERRVRIISQAVQQEIEEKVAKEAQALRDDLARSREGARTLEERIREGEERQLAKERQLADRECEVNRMYEELVKEWKEVEKQCEANKRNKPEHKNSNFYSPKVLPKVRADFDRSPIVEAEKEDIAPYYLSTRDLKPSVFSRDRLNYPKRTMEVYSNNSVSYLPTEENSLTLSFRKPAQPLNETDRFTTAFPRGEENRWERKEPVKMDFPAKSEYRQSGELSAINSKIQRLRKEINKELCAFHP